MLDPSEALYDQLITAENFDKSWKAHYIKWTVNYGWLEAKDLGNWTRMAILKPVFPGNILVNSKLKKYILLNMTLM